MKENPEESTEDEEVAEQNAFETETAGDYGGWLGGDGCDDFRDHSDFIIRVQQDAVSDHFRVSELFRKRDYRLYRKNGKSY